MLRHSLLPFALLAALAVPASAVDSAPTPAEWTPVQEALAAESPNAQAQLTALLRTYPAWADGNKALAKLLVDQGKAQEGLAAAKRAAQLAPDDIETLRIQVRALADLQRKTEIWTLTDQAGGKDPKGWLRYEAGLAAVRLGDLTKAEAYLKEAKARNPGKVPAELSFLESRVAIANRDFTRAELALANATAQQADFYDGWYELGRIRLVLADQDEAKRLDWVKKAAEAFAIVATKVADDPNGHIGVARAAIERAKLFVADGQSDNAGSSLRDAVVALRHALELKPDATEALVLLGDADLRLESWADAVTALRKAKSLGATDRALTFNLAIALQQSGNQAEAEALLKTVTATSPAEQVTIGMGAYRSRSWLLAATVLSKAADALDDAQAQAATWRFVGHAWAHLADARTGEERDELLNRAGEAWRRAGDLGDFPARRFFLAGAAARSPQHAYDGAWTAIGWDFLTPRAWGQVLGNYGAVKTGGRGIGGMLAIAPVHLAMWATLVVLPLTFWVLYLIRRGREQSRVIPARANAPRARGSTLSGTATSTQTSQSGTLSPTRATVSPATRAPTRSGTTRGGVAQKTDTEPLAPPPQAREKAETVSLPAKGGTVRPSTRPGALPRRPPGDGDATRP